MTGADDNAAVAALFTIGCTLTVGALSAAVVWLWEFHRRGVERLRRLQWLEESRSRRRHPAYRVKRLPRQRAGA